MFEDAMTTPSHYPLVITGHHHICYLHTEIGLRTNFQPDPGILKFSMMSLSLGGLHFCNLHAEISLPAKFQSDHPRRRRSLPVCELECAPPLAKKQQMLPYIKSEAEVIAFKIQEFKRSYLRVIIHKTIDQK